MSSRNVPPAKASFATETTIQQLGCYWRKQYSAKDNPFETASQSMLRSGDINTAIPPYHSNFGMPYAITDFLGRDIRSFNQVKQQLQSMIEVWDFIIEQKMSYDGLRLLPMLGNWQLMEDFLLCGRVISAKASIIPEHEALSSIDVGNKGLLSSHVSKRSFLSKSATSGELMDIDSGMDHDPGLATHHVQATETTVGGEPGGTGPRGSRKRKFSEMESDDCADGGRKRTGRKQVKTQGEVGERP